MATPLSFISLCGRCFRPIQPSSGGFILSCSDFVCGKCLIQPADGSLPNCPACGKVGVQALDICGKLPDEVRSSISDPTKTFDSLQNAFKFQIKYYKQVLKKILSRMMKLESESVEMKRTIQQLEQQLKEVVAEKNSLSNFSRSNNEMESNGLVWNSGSNTRNISKLHLSDNGISGRPGSAISVNSINNSGNNDNNNDFINGTGNGTDLYRAGSVSSKVTETLLPTPTSLAQAFSIPIEPSQLLQTPSGSQLHPQQQLQPPHHRVSWKDGDSSSSSMVHNNSSNSLSGKAIINNPNYNNGRSWPNRPSSTSSNSSQYGQQQQQQIENQHPNINSLNYNQYGILGKRPDIPDQEYHNMSQLYQNKKTNTTVQNMNGSNNNSNNNINNESSYSAQQPMHQPLVPSQLQPSSYNSNTYTTPSLNRVPTPKPGTPIPSNSNNANSGGGGNSSGMYKFPYSNSRPNSGNHSFITPSRLRSPHAPIIRSPGNIAAAAANPLAGRSVSVSQQDHHQQKQTPSAGSSIVSFLNNIGFKGQS